MKPTTLDPEPITPAEMERRHNERVARLSELWSRERQAGRDSAIRRRQKVLDKRRGEKYEADCNRVGVSVWQVDEAGNVIAKYKHGFDAAEKCGTKPGTINYAIQRRGCTADGRRFIRCGQPIKTFSTRGRRVMRLSDGRVFHSASELLPPRLKGKLRKAEYVRIYEAVSQGREYRGERYKFIGPARVLE